MGAERETERARIAAEMEKERTEEQAGEGSGQRVEA